jgi:hypothetical protein
VRPLCIDLFCGLGGWTDGFLTEGYDVVGFDNHQHIYGEARYPGQLVIQDVLTLHGSQFAGAACIVASPPCQAYSYMAMPWSRAKAMAAEIRRDRDRTRELNALFDACFRIQREAVHATGIRCLSCDGGRIGPPVYRSCDVPGCIRGTVYRNVPLVIENVKGAQPWVGPAKAHFGSFYLWGDVESVGGRVVVRPEFGAGIAAARRVQKIEGYSDPRRNGGQGAHLTSQQENDARGGQKFNPDGTAHGQGSWFAVADSKNRGAQKREGRNFHAFENGLGSSPSFNGAEHETRGTKQGGSGAAWLDTALDERRKAATAQRQELVSGVSPETHEAEGRKGLDGKSWIRDKSKDPRPSHGNSNSRKAASAMIAKIPLDLARFIARSYKPAEKARLEA